MAATKLGVKLASSLSGTRLLQQSGSARRLNTPAARRTHTTVAAATQDKTLERLPVAVAGAALAAPAAIPGAAHAQDVDSAVASIVDLVKASGEVVKQGVTAAQTGVEYAKAAYDQVAPVVITAVEKAAPVVEKGVKTAVDVATPALQTGLQEAEKVLSSSGVDPKAAEPLVQGTEQVVTTAKPFVEQALTFLTTTEPVVLGQYALGVVAAYYLAPPVLKATAGLLRGYAGDVSAAVALSAVEAEGNAYIVDIRSLKEKETAGLPELPNSGKLIELEYAAISDRKVRGQLRNPSGLEVQVTALQISALKKLGRGSTLFLMDRSGSGAVKAVAKALGGRGFGRVYVINGGFQGWTAGKLRVKAPTVVSRVEVLPPGTFTTPQVVRPKVVAATATTVSSRRALPSTISGSQ